LLGNSQATVDLEDDVNCYDKVANTLHFPNYSRNILIMSSRRDSEFQRLTERLRAAEQRAEAEGQRADEAEQRAQNTTFHEYLQACHEYLHKPLRVETNKSWTTQGQTNPAEKYYPKTLTPWEGFPSTEMEEFSKVSNIFYPPQQPALRLFSPIPSIAEQGRLFCNIQIANEPSLRTYEKVALEVHVADIINKLCELAQDQEQLRLGQKIIFENDGNSLSDKAKEVQERRRIQPPRTPSPAAEPSNPPPPDSNSDPEVVRTRADQYCIYKDEGGNRELLFLIEYKPPHKLTIGNLIGFRKMDLKKEVIDRIDIPAPIPIDQTDAEAEAVTVRLQYNADKVAVAVATQTFHYMIENGLEYSYIATGEAFVLLHIEEDDPTTLHYHVTVPSDEVDDDGSGFPYWQTAICQVVILCSLAFRSERRSHAWRKDAKKRLNKYPASSLETVLEKTPASERKLAAKRKRARKSLLYKGGRKVPVTSEYSLRSKDRSRDDELDDPDASSSPTRPSASGSRGQEKPGSQQKDKGGNNRKQASGSRGTQRQYCTQKCLLGIMQGSRRDENCPNALLHPRVGAKHAVGRSKFLGLVRQQLADDLDRNCEPLGLQGARGALFKITLASHGYVFVGKGTVQAFVPDLLHEGKVYRQLKDLQGTAVPVYLGNIDLVEWYYLDVGVRILHMLLMSWGGNLAEQDETVNTAELPKWIQQTVAEVRRAGIDQMDVRSPNLLWNQEAQRVMLIDFERAIMIQAEPKERVMQEISPNKRKRAGSPEQKMRRKASI
jgi:hypothetical protein